MQKNRRKDAEGELKGLKINWEVRVSEEVSNSLNNRIATKRCRYCGFFFWVDKSAKKEKHPYYVCPYCSSSSDLEDFPYNIFLYQNKAVIIAYIPGQINENIQIETAKENVTIRSIDGIHCIDVPLETYLKPKIADKTYKDNILTLTVERGNEAVGYIIGYAPKT